MTTKTRGLFDWLPFCYTASYQIKNINYKMRSDIEMEEIGRLITEHVYKLIKRFKIEDSIFALDVPSGTGWRTPFFDSQYKAETNFWKSMIKKQSWFVEFDKQIHKVEMNEHSQMWIYTKFSEKKLKDEEIDLTNAEQFLFFEKGVTPAWIMESYPDSPAHAYDHPDFPGLNEIIPSYKGGRDKKWHLETPKEEFKEYCEDLAYNLGHLFGARVVKVPFAEADDIIAVASTLETATETIIMTVDHDLHQLLANGLFVKYYDIRKHTFMQKTEYQARYDLFVKIIGGDSSDKINGCSLKDRKGKFPEVTYKKLADGTMGVKDGKGTVNYVDAYLGKLKCKKEQIWQKLQAHFYDKQLNNTFFRNQILINLKAIPAELVESIKVGLARGPVSGPQIIADYLNIEYDLKIADFGVTEVDKMAIDAQAHEDRVDDLSNGYVETKVGDE